MAETGGVFLRAYRLGGDLAQPFLPLVLSWRGARGKEDRTRLSERRGLASRERPAGKLVWIHAASVGETNAVLPLIGRILAMGPRVLLTTVTVTSAAIAQTRLPEGAIHQFAPVDVPAWIERFLMHWRPDLALVTESELWPGVIASLAEAAIPLALVNARLSKRSFARWRRLGRAGEALLAPISLCLAQSAEHGSRYGALGLAQVKVTGNLKFDVPAPSADPVMFAKLKGEFGARLLWLAASTHEGEESIAGAVHKRLKSRFPSLLTIIVPRHPPRGRAIAQGLSGEGLNVALRSAEDRVQGETDIYLADTLGELGLFYRLAPIAFIGGSLIAHGGQNPIEPVKLGAVSLHGPYVSNFAEVYAALDEVDPASRVADMEGLVSAVALLLAEPGRRGARAKITADALVPFSGALEATLQALMPLLSPLSKAEGAP